MNYLRFKKPLLTLSFAVAALTPAPPANEPEVKFYSPLYFPPSNIENLSRQRPRLKDEIHTSYRYLRNTCSALNRVNIKHTWNVADWMKKNITKEEWAAAPYSFRMNSYRAIAVQKNSTTKLAVLADLSETIPFHPDFIAWIDDRRQEMKKSVDSDPYLIKERKNWAKLVKNEDRLKAYIFRISEIVYETYLPGLDYTKPNLVIRRDGQGLESLRGYVNGNTISLNFSGNEASLKTPDQVNRSVTHEFFHITQGIFGRLARKGKFDHNKALKDAGIKFSYSFSFDLAQIPSQANEKGYRASFHERTAYYVASGLDKKPNYQSRDPLWKETSINGEFGRFSEAGVLPSACFK